LKHLLNNSILEFSLVYLYCGLRYIIGVGLALSEKKIRISFIKNLAPDIQPALKVSGVKCFITGVKIISTETAYGALEPIL
jgi:hypothetical protein